MVPEERADDIARQSPAMKNVRSRTDRHPCKSAQADYNDDKQNPPNIPKNNSIFMTMNFGPFYSCRQRRQSSVALLRGPAKCGPR